MFNFKICHKTKYDAHSSGSFTRLPAFPSGKTYSVKKKTLSMSKYCQLGNVFVNRGKYCPL